jgi:hypothetical protein
MPDRAFNTLAAVGVSPTLHVRDLSPARRQQIAKEVANDPLCAFRTKVGR